MSEQTATYKTHTSVPDCYIEQISVGLRKNTLRLESRCVFQYVCSKVFKNYKVFIQTLFLNTTKEILKRTSSSKDKKKYT